MYQNFKELAIIEILFITIRYDNVHTQQYVQYDIVQKGNKVLIKSLCHTTNKPKVMF